MEPGWASYNVYKAPGVFENPLTNWPMPVRAPNDDLPGTDRCCTSRTATGREATCIFRSTDTIELHTYFSHFSPEAIDINTKILISHEKLRVNNMQ